MPQQSRAACLVIPPFSLLMFVKVENENALNEKVELENIDLEEVRKLYDQSWRVTQKTLLIIQHIYNQKLA